jgi:NADH-quinone oxidoreductase subunit L
MLTLRFGWLVDSMTAIMLVVVTTVAAMVQIYSHGYMAGDPRFPRFYAYLSLFTMAMLALVLANNLVELFIAWELMGLASYLLIGYWFEKPAAMRAAKKAFIVTRVGDMGLFFGIALLVGTVGTTDFMGLVVARPDGRLPADTQGWISPLAVSAGPAILEKTAPVHTYGPEGALRHGLGEAHAEHAPPIAPASGPINDAAAPVPDPTAVDSARGFMVLLGICALLIFCGAIGKSAQFPLHVWLPDAMEGPTPVSALIHAATMVAAGVYLVARMYPVFDYGGPLMFGGATFRPLDVVAVIGTITALMAALIALTQPDIKRILAYSTCSQLGFMMAGLGCGGTIIGSGLSRPGLEAPAFVHLGFTAGIFHLMTHAFFKGLLFLGSGSVIHGTGTQDVWEMGGLRRFMPKTFWPYFIGYLALAGVPLLSGFFSKDLILDAAWEFNKATKLSSPSSSSPPASPAST